MRRLAGLSACPALVLRYTGRRDDPCDLVSITIVSLPDGCELTLQHEMGAEYAEYLERTEKGWATILESLAATLSSVQ